jgi:predicted nuclease with RNAse H fold
MDLMAEQEKTGYGHFRDHVPPEAREHARNAREEMRKSWATLLPPEFIAHRRRARKEMLLAARELINHALEHLETHEETTE